MHIIDKTRKYTYHMQLEKCSLRPQRDTTTYLLVKIILKLDSINSDEGTEKAGCTHITI